MSDELSTNFWSTQNPPILTQSSTPAPQADSNSPKAQWNPYVSGYANYVPGMQNHPYIASSNGALSFGLMKTAPDGYWHSDRIGLLYRHSLQNSTGTHTYTTSAGRHDFDFDFSFTTYGAEWISTTSFRKAPDWGWYTRMPAGIVFVRDEITGTNQDYTELPFVHIGFSCGLAFHPKDVPLEIDGGFGYTLFSFWLGATDLLLGAGATAIIPNPEAAITFKL